MMAKTPDLFTGAGLERIELERDFQDRVTSLARINGWTVYSVPDSRRASLAGYPDLTMWRGQRLIFAELKREKGRVSPQQVIIMDELRQLPMVEVFLWRPSHWNEIVETLRRGNDAPKA
jgi:hypothetical protein